MLASGYIFVLKNDRIWLHQSEYICIYEYICISEYTGIRTYTRIRANIYINEYTCIGVNIFPPEYILALQNIYIRPYPHRSIYLYWDRYIRIKEYTRIVACSCIRANVFALEQIYLYRGMCLHHSECISIRASVFTSERMHLY